ncbi:MAG: chromosome segregation protein SMC, partial [Rhizobacter sp.]
EQRLIELKAQIAQWDERQAEAQAELERIAEQIATADEQGEVLAGQAEEQQDHLPRLEDAVRAAQSKANEQRTVVAGVQQQIQVLAADQRNIEDQSRQLTLRAERLRSDQSALAAPDETRLRDLQAQLAAAQEASTEADARLHELQEAVPQLDDDRRNRQQAVNTEGARHAELSARLEALRALQEKVKTDGKLAPWLAKHGLESLQGLWSRIHIEQGWENALESALRERLGALEVSRLDMVRAFGGDAPPAKLAFYTPPSGAIANTHATLPRLSDLLRLGGQVGDAGLAALLNDWLEGVYTAASLDE